MFSFKLVEPSQQLINLVVLVLQGQGEEGEEEVDEQELKQRKEEQVCTKNHNKQLYTSALEVGIVSNLVGTG